MQKFIRKFGKLFWSFSLTLILVIAIANPAPTQTGNQSDATNPNPIEIVPETTEESEQFGEESVEVTPDSSEESEQNEPSQEAVSEESEVDRAGYESLVGSETESGAVQAFEEAQASDFSSQLGIDFYGKTPSIDEIAAALYDIYLVTGKKATINYVFALENELQTLTIFPKSRTSAKSSGQLIASKILGNLGPIAQEDQISPAIRKSTLVSREELEKTLNSFRDEITNPRKIRQTTYLKPAQQLYQWIVAPIESELQENKIDDLVFAMDTGLRSTPVAAMHDGKQFLIEKYGVSLIPSFGLTDSRYRDVRNLKILAMGASTFTDQNDLPAVPVELAEILRGAWQGEKFINEQFTVENFIEQNKKQNFAIIHLATHGEFQSGDISNSYIQFWNRKLNMNELRKLAGELGWNSASSQPIELMVLSACRTALGDEQAELGFAGLAVQAGVKSALASLWYVSDAGSLALMNEFYQHLNITANKAEALRQAQLAMIRGKVQVEQGQLRGSDQEPLPLPDQLARSNVNFSHPYFWSGFILIGNWN
ncbi:CHAT domain-containing protein [Ancylothrix sp. C2]|uniref:CHAT domain-containing protein n=1 Tax=Ancylothrix sp. D3o TaxID=2953691 RepID=UPI0021BAF063|nr:CHAT domain-containing protein [Ancylothrix sp. D3o]MCT7948999.1 CHAT domain-containing protein [Ancylothrix sp. D3o]